MRWRVSAPTLLTSLVLALLVGGPRAAIAEDPPEPQLAFEAAPAPLTPPWVPPGAGLTVAANQLLRSDGSSTRLLGVNWSGGEFACVHAWGTSGVFFGQTNDQAIDALQRWHVNAVRLPLNEDCWLGLNASSQDVGAPYRAFVVDFVHRLTGRGLAVVLDLHWNAPGEQLAATAQAMPDRDHAPAFWSSIAQTFADDPLVLFDLYNEPHPLDGKDSEVAWTCLRDGGECPGIPFTAAGTQELLDAIRETGATNVVLVPGVAWSGDVSRWADYAPVDPLESLVVSWHQYNFAACTTPACWDRMLTPLAAQYPVVAGEIGETSQTCDHTWTDSLLPWLDQHGIGYLVWAWVPFNCNQPGLIVDYNGTPNPYGAAVRAHFQALAR